MPQAEIGFGLAAAGGKTAGRAISRSACLRSESPAMLSRMNRQLEGRHSVLVRDWIARSACVAVRAARRLRVHEPECVSGRYRAGQNVEPSRIRWRAVSISAMSALRLAPAHRKPPSSWRLRDPRRIKGPAERKRHRKARAVPSRARREPHAEHPRDFRRVLRSALPSTSPAAAGRPHRVSASPAPLRSMMRSVGLTAHRRHRDSEIGTLRESLECAGEVARGRKPSGRQARAAPGTEGYIA